MPRAQPHLFPYNFFEPLEESARTADLFWEELEATNGWRRSWMPVFWSQTSGYAVDANGGEVWLVGVDSADEEHAAATLTDLVIEVTDQFRDGTYYFDRIHGVQRS